MPEVINPKVFISYCHTSESHKKWVLDLAVRLRQNGVDVILDQWDLKHGHDVNAFMEDSIKKDDLKHILMICDEGYCKKANNHHETTGVHKEMQLLNKESYDAYQTKIIPVVAQKDEKGKAYLPWRIEGKIFVDLSNEDEFEDKYEELLRCIFDAPLQRKPELGKKPAWLDEDSPNALKCTTIVKTLATAMEKGNTYKIESLVDDFFEEFTEEFKKYEVVKDNLSNEDLVKMVVKKIEEMLEIRNSFISFMEIYARYSKFSIFRVLELIESLCKPFDISNSDDSIATQYKFCIFEIVIYLFTILLKSEKYNDIVIMFNFEFSGNNFSPTFSFCRLRPYMSILENNIIFEGGKKSSSNTAELLLRRATLKRYDRNTLIQTDSLLYYLSKFYFAGFDYWFPWTAVYLSHNIKIKFLHELKHSSLFEQRKLLFGVQTKEEFIEKCKTIVFNENQGRYNIHNILYYISAEEICSKP